MNRPEKFEPMWKAWSTYVYLFALIAGITLGMLAR